MKEEPTNEAPKEPRGLPLSGLLVLDFSTLLPGPLATLMLAEAGAEVVKVERPGTGEDMRAADPMYQGESLAYAVLNRGKKCIALDLKSKKAIAELTPLIERADILVEQFRPGVMERLGLGYQAVAKLNQNIIYCSITGYGQTGPNRLKAGHDLNYIGDSGLLSLSSGPSDRPTIPPALIADVGGGSYPAMVNILLALRHRDQTGEGTHIDIAMSDNLFAFSFQAFAQGAGIGEDLPNGSGAFTGGSPRYNLYPASDGRLVAVAALEQKFWNVFCAKIDLPTELRDDQNDPDATRQAVAEILAGRSSDDWHRIFEKADCCCTVVRNMNEVQNDQHFAERGIFNWTIEGAHGGSVTALPVPIAPQFRLPPGQSKPVPGVGADNQAFGVSGQSPLSSEPGKPDKQGDET